MKRLTLFTIPLILLIALCASVLSNAPQTPPTPSSHFTLMHSATGCPSYTVRAGDWLSRIAARYGVPWQRLAALNHLSNPNIIYPGEVLCVASSTTPPPWTPHAIYHHAHFADTGVKGWCVWYAVGRRSDLNLVGAGDAWQLAASAAHRGYHVGAVPAVGALAIFARGVQGASAQYGHAAYVTATYADGSFEIAAMAAPWPWMVSYSRHWTAPGVQFVYG